MISMISLDKLPLGSRGYIVQIREKNTREINKMAAFGFFPGVEVEMIQTFPSYVLNVGFTQVALDDTVVRAIWVQPKGKDLA